MGFTPLAVEYPNEAGTLTRRSHKVQGKVTILDEKRIQISDLVYDGKGPRTFFHVGTDHSIESLKQNLNNGHQIPYQDHCINNNAISPPSSDPCPCPSWWPPMIPCPFWPCPPCGTASGY